MNKWRKASDGWFDFYVNIETGEKKLTLDDNDVEEKTPKLDDFYRKTLSL